jgi:hypothetical protein
MSISDDKTMRQDGTRVWVTLTLSELLHGVTVGALRSYESRKQSFEKGTHGLNTDDENLLAMDLEGALGEICVSKVLNKYWGGGVNTYKGADIGDSIQVRTRSKHTYDLLVRDGDNPAHFYFHVTGMYPEYCVRGWMKGTNAKDPKYLAGHGGRPSAYFIPESDLRPIDIKP